MIMVKAGQIYQQIVSADVGNIFILIAGTPCEMRVYPVVQDN